MTLPEIKIGWIEAVVLDRLGGIARDEPLLELLVPRCAMAADVSAVIPNNTKALKREELRFIAPSNWEFFMAV
jgi:hypothetical protein